VCAARTTAGISAAQAANSDGVSCAWHTSSKSPAASKAATTKTRWLERGTGKTLWGVKSAGTRLNAAAQIVSHDRRVRAVHCNFYRLVPGQTHELDGSQRASRGASLAATLAGARVGTGRLFGGSTRCAVRSSDRRRHRCVLRWSPRAFDWNLFVSRCWMKTVRSRPGSPLRLRHRSDGLAYLWLPAD
jgi:hypothetical protein